MALPPARFCHLTNVAHEYPIGICPYARKQARFPCENVWNSANSATKCIFGFLAHTIFLFSMIPVNKIKHHRAADAAFEGLNGEQAIRSYNAKRLANIAKICSFNGDRWYSAIPCANHWARGIKCWISAAFARHRCFPLIFSRFQVSKHATLLEDATIDNTSLSVSKVKILVPFDSVQGEIANKEKCKIN